MLLLTQFYFVFERTMNPIELIFGDSLSTLKIMALNSCSNINKSCWRSISAVNKAKYSLQKTMSNKPSATLQSSILADLFKGNALI